MGYRLILFCLISFFPLKSWGAANTCVMCHQGLKPSLTRAHDFGEWAGSIHAQKGVACEACHGGNPNESEAQKAHQGVLKSKNSQGPLYFANIPETCGDCHTAELAAFKKSYHYRELKRTGKGPNCVTCHGSMATHILNPKELDQSCSFCHAQRGIASEALVTLNEAGAQLKKWGALAKTLSSDEQMIDRQRETYRSLKVKWHSFDLEKVLKGAQEIIKTARSQMQSLKLKTGVK